MATLQDLGVTIKADTQPFEMALSGIDESKVQHITIELDRLRRQGLLVEVVVSGISMFTRRAQFAEAGITEGDERVKRYTPGSKYLIPKPVVERLRSVEVRMREAINKYSYGDIEGFRPYRWLPWKSYRAFRDRWDELLAEFEDLKVEIIGQYDYYRDELSEDYAASARQAWSSIVGQGYTAVIYNGKGYWDRYEFIDAVVDDALRMFPTIQRIQTDLKADYKVGLVQSDIDIEQERAIAVLQQQKAEHEAHEAYLKQSLAQEQYDNERRMNQLAQREKELQIQAMMQAEMEHAKAQLAEIKSPFEEVFTALRSQIADDCQTILESVQKNGYVPGKVATKARGLVEMFDLLAIHDDEKLREKLVELKSTLDTIAVQKSETGITKVESTLEDIINLSHKVAEDLDSCRASFLE
jgi:hypothetical protein